MPEHRSGCPINLATEVLGDKWSLVILRDMMFGDRRYFRELLNGSVEGIASNILADRLQRLVTNGLVSRAPDPTHKQKIRYSLTEPAIQLVPIMAHLGAWGRRHLPVTRELAIRAELLETGGPELWDRFMDELRERHLGLPRPAGAESVVAYLRAAYEAAAVGGEFGESAPGMSSSERHQCPPAVVASQDGTTAGGRRSG